MDAEYQCLIQLGVKHNVSVGEYMASQLNYLLAELESMLTTRVSETVN